MGLKKLSLSEVFEAWFWAYWVMSAGIVPLLGTHRFVGLIPVHRWSLEKDTVWAIIAARHKLCSSPDASRTSVSFYSFGASHAKATSRLTTYQA